MSKIRKLTVVLVIAVLFATMALAEGYPESEHPYANSSDVTWTYEYSEEAYALKITFSDDTAFESGYDYLYVTGEDGTQQKFTGTALAGEAVYVMGNSFTLRLTSDSSVTYNGFTITNVEAVTQEAYEEYVATPKFTINSSGTITAYSGLVENLEIPTEIDGTAVTGIGSSVFRDNTALKSVVIPEGVTSIGGSAFYGCSGLTSVNIPEGVTSIGSSAFYNCSNLTSMNIPEGVTSIGGSTFRGCSSLTSMNIPEGVTSIGDWVFGYCSSLTSVTIPASVTSIGSYAFRGCSSLTSVNIPEGVTSIESDAFSGCSSLTSVNIPESVISIGSSAFSGCSSLTSVNIPEGMTSIERYVFSVCSSLTSVTIPEGVMSIGDGAFSNCSGLMSVTIPESVTSIGSYAFYNCSSLTSVTVPESVTSIGSYAFAWCDELTRIELPDTIESIGESAFHHNTVLVFGSSALIEEYAIDNSLQYICDDKEVTSEGIDTAEEMVEWAVATYTSSGMSEYEKALKLYNWLCAHTQYDYQYYNNGKCDGEYSSEYGVGSNGALLGGYAVCSGYAAAYKLLLEEAGIEVVVVSGYNHAWNIAKIDGEWYHFDATWDDSGNAADYDYFALSDMAIHSEPENHATQENYRHLVCDSWEANYYYRNGDLDAALETLSSAINESISAGTYSGEITLEYSERPEGMRSEYTVALILNNRTDWAVDGRVEIILPAEDYSSSNDEYGFVFYPDAEVVTDILVDGIDECTNGLYYMYPGYTAQMSASTLPQGNDITYASSDESVVTVSQDGLVTAVASGDATITLTSGNCSRSFSIYVSNISWLISESTYYLDVGEIRQIDLNASNWFLTDSADTWTVSDEAIATIDQNGLLTSLAEGKVTVTITTAAGVTDTAEVYVRKPVSAVVIEQETYEAYEGQYITLTVWVEGCNQDFYKENFSYYYSSGFYVTSSDTTIVDTGYGSYSPEWNEETGYWEYHPRVKCLATGEVTVTLTARDGSGVSASCTIKVAEAPQLESAAFVSDTYEAMAGQYITLTLRADTGDGDPDYYAETYYSFTYTSSNEEIVKYSGSYYPVWNEEAGCWEYEARVQCLTPGEVTFTATAKDKSGVSASCTIKVAEEPQLESAEFVSDTYEAMEGQYITLTLRADAGEGDPDYYAENYRYFTYTSSNEEIAEYSGSYSPVWNEEAGCWEYRTLVQALKIGAVNFMGMARDGSEVSASCTIVVNSSQQLIVPTALKQISDEAFMATAAEQIVLSESVEYIGARAFADSAELKLINLPENISYIASDAFDGSDNVTVVCAEGSYAHSWCVEHGVAFVLQ